MSFFALCCFVRLLFVCFSGTETQVSGLMSVGEMIGEDSVVLRNKRRNDRDRSCFEPHSRQTTVLAKAVGYFMCLASKNTILRADTLYPTPKMNSLSKTNLVSILISIFHQFE